ncbi:MAG: dinitrogenase iron-molybdenum cofactor biosynthesis protein [Methanomassiliicoccales archaeon]|nr:MAG: dinitrogenase iron-molybdenum cofactor biosynthesis protein [Methanomassiliicoccales archaeon]
MKVCVPTLGDRGLLENVSPHFGRAPTFTIVDMDTDDVRVIPNISEHMGGAGKPPEHLAEAGVETMLCSGLGPRAVNMFEEYGIEVYVGAEGTVQDTLEKWKNNQLAMATDENACKMHRHH